MSHAVVTEADVKAWCVDFLAALLEVPATDIDPTRTFPDLGLDSAAAVHLVVGIEEWLGIELSPDVVNDHPTIDALARFLVMPKT